MLAKLALLASIATASNASLMLPAFRLFWFWETTSGDQVYGSAWPWHGVKILTNTAPDCKDFYASQDFLFNPDEDVSDSRYGGGVIRCEGCDENKKGWNHDEIEINNFYRDYFTLYKQGNRNWVVNDVDDNVIGTCELIANPQELMCGTVWGPYGGTAFVDCNPLEMSQSDNDLMDWNTGMKDTDGAQT